MGPRGDSWTNSLLVDECEASRQFLPLYFLFNMSNETREGPQMSGPSLVTGGMRADVAATWGDSSYRTPER